MEATQEFTVAGAADALIDSGKISFTDAWDTERSHPEAFAACKTADELEALIMGHIAPLRKPIPEPAPTPGAAKDAAPLDWVHELPYGKDQTKVLVDRALGGLDLLPGVRGEAARRITAECEARHLTAGAAVAYAIEAAYGRKEGGTIMVNGRSIAMPADQGYTVSGPAEDKRHPAAIAADVVRRSGLATRADIERVATKLAGQLAHDRTPGEAVARYVDALLTETQGGRDKRFMDGVRQKEADDLAARRKAEDEQAQRRRDAEDEETRRQRARQDQQRHQAVSGLPRF